MHLGSFRENQRRYILFLEEISPILVFINITILFRLKKVSSILKISKLPKILFNSSPSANTKEKYRTGPSKDNYAQRLLTSTQKIQLGSRLERRCRSKACHSWRMSFKLAFESIQLTKNQENQTRLQDKIYKRVRKTSRATEDPALQSKGRISRSR